MVYWSSLRGGTGTFPYVVTTCASCFSLLFQSIASLPNIISQAFKSLYYTFLTLQSGRLALGSQVLHNQQKENNDNEIRESNEQPEFLQHLPLCQLIWIARTEKLKPNTKGTVVFCHTSYNTLPGTNWAQSAIEHLLLTAKAHAIYLQQVPQNDGQTEAGTSTSTRPHAASLKRKASSASVRQSRARRINNRGNGDDENDGEDNPNPPNAPQNNQEDPAEPDSEKYFACHFFKLNPREYHRCGSKQLKTLDNVKQHLKRAHYTPGLHCRGCWAEFGDDQEALRIHANGECDQRQGPDTLYDEDMRLLSTERGSTDYDKWYQIWRQICEGHQEPDSPYIDMNAIDESGRLIGRDIQSRIMALLPSLCNRFEYQVAPELTTRIVNTLINETFSHPALFEYRHRRTFRPISATEPQSPSDFLPPLDPALFGN
ncbi:hypothetical protein V8F33_010596 [Rhypophila sp. PSN 637]